jgi:hypothetical protein
MDGIVVPAIIREAFTLSVERRQEVCFKLTGNAEMEMLPILGPYLVQLHEHLCHEREGSVVVDMSELYFMNSSCFKAIITWISGIRKLEPSEAYKVRFVTNPKLHWQRRNLEAIREFAPSIVEVIASQNLSH